MNHRGPGQVPWTAIAVCPSLRYTSICSLLQKLIVTQTVKKLRALQGTESSSQCSQDLTINPHPKPD
jgi:hypothetical protein